MCLRNLTSQASRNEYAKCSFGMEHAYGYRDTIKSGVFIDPFRNTGSNLTFITQAERTLSRNSAQQQLRVALSSVGSHQNPKCFVQFPAWSFHTSCKSASSSCLLAATSLRATVSSLCLRAEARIAITLPSSPAFGSAT